MSFLNNLFGGQGSVSLLSAAEAKQELDSGADILLVDVRNPDEYAKGHIPGSIPIPLSSLPDQASNKLSDKTQRILIYCLIGSRAANAAALLTKMGYTNVASFGGIKNWPYEIER